MDELMFQEFNFQEVSSQLFVGVMLVCLLYIGNFLPFALEDQLVPLVLYGQCLAHPKKTKTGNCLQYIDNKYMW